MLQRGAKTGQRLVMDASRDGGCNALTRTTLQIEYGASAAAIAAAIRRLQRVPGVLLADMSATNTRAVVAHDAAVDTASLVDAVAAAGLRSAIVMPQRPVQASEPPVHSNAAIVRAFVSATIVVVALTLVDLTVPDGADRRWLLPAASISFFIFMFARSVVTRRP